MDLHIRFSSVSRIPRILNRYLFLCIYTESLAFIYSTRVCQNSTLAAAETETLSTPVPATGRAEYVKSLKGYALQGSLLEGKLLHACIIHNGNPDVVLSNALINLYGKCGALLDAFSIFSHMASRDVVSWNTLISSYVFHGQAKEAFGCFKQMQHGNIRPDSVTCITVLSACTNHEVLDNGMDVHNFILMNGLDIDLTVQNSIISMYGKCGCLEAACLVFDSVSQDDVISWNVLISACPNNGSDGKALQLYSQMHQKSVIPNRVTYISVLSACTNRLALRDGKLIHAGVATTDMIFDVVLSTTIMNMYGKCAKTDDAFDVFESMPHKNVVSWNAMISICAQNDKNNLAYQLFCEMQMQDILPSRFTFISLLEACAGKGTLNEGKQLHVLIQGKDLETDIVVANALLTMYGKHCRLNYLRDSFDKMSHRNDVTWNVMISNSAQNQHGGDAVDLFNQMLQESYLPNKVTYLSVLDACASQEDITRGKEFHAQIISSCFKDDNMVINTLVNLYSKCNQMATAMEMFYSICEHDVVSWSAIIAGFAQQGQCEEALFIFDQMCQDGMMPNKITYASILSACADQSLQAPGKHIHAVIMTRRLECEPIVANSLINLYGKCGNLGYIKYIFDEMPVRDTVSWTAMIVSYAQHGERESALKLFYQMQEERIRPNRVTLLGVLSSCNHAGDLDEGLIWFASMEARFGIRATVDHYNCMIDLLGRAGKLDEAEQLVMSTPSEVTIVSLMALLSACKYQCDVERGERFANKTFALFPNNAEPYVMLANIYSSVGRITDADKMMDAMRAKGIEALID